MQDLIYLSLSPFIRGGAVILSRGVFFFRSHSASKCKIVFPIVILMWFELANSANPSLFESLRVVSEWRRHDDVEQHIMCWRDFQEAINAETIEI